MVFVLDTGDSWLIARDIKNYTWRISAPDENRYGQSVVFSPTEAFTEKRALRVNDGEKIINKSAFCVTRAQQLFRSCSMWHN